MCLLQTCSCKVLCGKLSREQANDDVRKKMDVFAELGAKSISSRDPGPPPPLSTDPPAPESLSEGPPTAPLLVVLPSSLSHADLGFDEVLGDAIASMSGCRGFTHLPASRRGAQKSSWEELSFMRCQAWAQGH